jgi:hypothetical protein
MLRDEITELDGSSQKLDPGCSSRIPEPGSGFFFLKSTGSRFRICNTSSKDRILQKKTSKEKCCWLIHFPPGNTATSVRSEILDKKNTV